MGHVHVDDGSEDGQDGAVGDHGAGGHVRSVTHGLLHALVHCPTLKGSKAPDLSWLLLCLWWNCGCLSSAHLRDISSQEPSSGGNFGWDAHFHNLLRDFLYLALKYFLCFLGCVLADGLCHLYLLASADFDWLKEETSEAGSQPAWLCVQVLSDVTWARPWKCCLSVQLQLVLFLWCVFVFIITNIVWGEFWIVTYAVCW